MSKLEKRSPHAFNHIGKTYGIKKVVGMIIAEDDEDNYNFHTMCTLCKNITDVLWTKFLNDKQYQYSCDACGARITFAKDSAPKPMEKPRPKPEAKPPIAKPAPIAAPPVVTEVVTEAEHITVEEPAPSKPEEPAPVEKRKTPKRGKYIGGTLAESTEVPGMSQRVYDKYAPLLGESVNGKRIDRLVGRGRNASYILVCEYCGQESKYIASTVVNHPEEVPGCKCVFYKIKHKKPDLGSHIDGFTVTDVYKSDDFRWKAKVECDTCHSTLTLPARDLFDGLTCSFCKNNKNTKNTIQAVKEDVVTRPLETPAVKTPKEPETKDDKESSLTSKILSESSLHNMKPSEKKELADQIRKKLSGMPVGKSVTLSDAAGIPTTNPTVKSPEAKSTSRGTTNNPKFPVPVIIVNGEKEMIDTTADANKHLYNIYRNMIQRARASKQQVSLDWYDDDIPLVENAYGFKKFFMWSYRHGYQRSMSASGVNICRLLRRDTTMGYTPDNCYWGIIGS